MTIDIASAKETKDGAELTCQVVNPPNGGHIQGQLEDGTWADMATFTHHGLAILRLRVRGKDR